MGSGGLRLELTHSAELGARLELGASLAVSGACLTVVEQGSDGPQGVWTAVELSPETLERTTLSRLRAASEVNLEPALRLGDALGGHFVQGHVDTTTAVCARREQSEFRILAFEVPAPLRSCLVEKGSVTVDGVSLTVAALTDGDFEVALIPHTLAVTTLGGLEVGDRVNLEVDVLARYVQRALEVWR